MTKKKTDASAPTRLSRYRKVEVRIWGDEKFRRLSPIPPCGQGLFLHLITGPHTSPIPGLFSAGRAAIAETLDWDVEAFDKAFEEAFREGLAEADWKARVVWIPKAIKHNKPESPNVVRGWATEFDLIPECNLKWKALDALKASIHALGEAYGKAFDETFGKGSGKASGNTTGNQEQEQEQEQKLKDTPLPPKGGKGAKSKSEPQNLGVQLQQFTDFWAAYPRKTGKPDAFKAFSALKVSPELFAKILAGLAKWKKCARWTKDGGEFIKHPGPWLRNRLWEDEEVCGTAAATMAASLGKPAYDPLDWVKAAGFTCIDEAHNLGCNPVNFSNFKDGERVRSDAAVPA